MEVPHTHTHAHAKKKFKEYFLEFLMLFLAVTLGFLAENFREHLTEKRREKEYITSFVSDLKKDTGAVTKTGRQLFNNLQHGDSLIWLLQHYANTDSINKKCYKHYLLGTANIALMRFNESTLTQLLYTGGMQLIGHRRITDSILSYGAFTKVAAEQAQYYKAEFDKGFDFSANIFDFSYIHVRLDPDYSTHPMVGYDTAHFRLVNNDPATLQKYSSYLIMQSNLSMSYLLILKQIKAYATRMIVFLEKEYDLE